MTTFELLKNMIVDHGYARPEQIEERSGFVDDLGMDSLDLVESLVAAEEEFSIEITDDEAETLLTVGDAVKLIDRRTP